ncbi:heme-binding protein [Thauera humireducens]
MNKLSILAATFVLTTAGAAQAQVLSQRTLGLELANRLAADAVQACAEKGYAVSATVVDRAGIVRAVQRADNAGPHTLAASQQKAFTSASARNATQAMMEAAQKNPGAANLTDIPGFLLLGGGVPVRVGDEVIGAIGIGGAPGGHLDEQCALAAVAASAELLKQGRNGLQASGGFERHESVRSCWPADRPGREAPDDDAPSAPSPARSRRCQGCGDPR